VLGRQTSSSSNELYHHPFGSRSGGLTIRQGGGQPARSSFFVWRIYDFHLDPCSFFVDRNCKEHHSWFIFVSMLATFLFIFLSSFMMIGTEPWYRMIPLSLIFNNR
jgi:hypothetical protein